MVCKKSFFKRILIFLIAQIVFIVNACFALSDSIGYSNISPNININQQLVQQIFSKGINNVFTRKVRIPNSLGLHARPSVAIANIAQEFSETEIFLSESGSDKKVDAKSVLDIMTLALQQGEQVVVSAQGREAQKAVDELSSFIEQLVYFDGDEDIAYSLEDAPLDPVIIGTKALNTVKMHDYDIPVPPGFIVVADREFSPKILKAYLKSNIKKLTKDFIKDKSLIVSVRSSPMRSAPGLYDTILNVGITAEIANSLGAQGRGWQLYYEYLYELAVKGLDINPDLFKNVLVADPKKRTLAYSQIIQQEMKNRGKELTGDDQIFPMDFIDQLVYTILAIKKSGESSEVKMLRKAQGLESEEAPIAVKVQQMVFGNADNNSGSFTLSTIDAKDKGDEIIIEYGKGLQGKAIVDGRIIPKHISASGIPAEALSEIKSIVKKLQTIFETPYLQIEGVIEKGKVYILQSRINNNSQQIFTKKPANSRENVLIGTTIFTKNPEKKVKGKVLKLLNQSDLPVDTENPYVLAFEYADAKSVRILFDAVFNKKLNIVAVVTSNGGTQSHFARQIELLNDLGKEIPYMSAVDYGLVQADKNIIFDPKEGILILDRDKTEELFNLKIPQNESIDNQKELPLIIGHSI